jgi:hypothetical protein
LQRLPDGVAVPGGVTFAGPGLQQRRVLGDVGGPYPAGGTEFTAQFGQFFVDARDKLLGRLGRRIGGMSGGRFHSGLFAGDDKERNENDR